MNRIKEMIRASGLRSNFVAEKLGVHPTHISMWQSGERHPNKKRIRELCKLLHCKLKDLFPEGVKNG